jgi:hypothetical protein
MNTLLVAVLVLTHAAICAGSSAIIAHAKGRGDAVTLVASLGFFLGPIGVLSACFADTAEVKARRDLVWAEWKAAREAKKQARAEARK